jgi:hypothetical protein
LLQSVVDRLALKGHTLIGVKGIEREARVRSPSLVGPLLRSVIDSLTVKGEHSDGALRVCRGYCNRG